MSVNGNNDPGIMRRDNGIRILSFSDIWILLKTACGRLYRRIDEPTYDIAMQEDSWLTLRNHLFSGDQKEAAAILLCGLGQSEGYTRLMVRKIITVEPEDCHVRTVSKVSWRTEKYLTTELEEKMDKHGLSLVTVHSHPAGCDEFSAIDDHNDHCLFSSVHGWFDDNRPHGSLVMLPDGSMFGRVVGADGKFTPFSKISVAGVDLQIWHKKQRGKQYNKKDDQFGMRVLQTFGKKTFHLLRELKVGVVGCSGTGSIVAELLARNCIGHIVLVDTDHIEQKNLNRILNSTARDARVSALKVNVIEQAIKKLGMKIKIQKIVARTHEDQARDSLKSCDVIFGCVDSHEGRYHLDCYSAAYLIPYFDVGVRLDADKHGGIQKIIVAAHYVRPGGQSLKERGAYNSEQLRAEGIKRRNQTQYKKEQEAGYLIDVGEDHPAVISVNMQAACMAVNDFLARLHKYRYGENSEFAIQRFDLTDGVYESEKEEEGATYFAKHLGIGDRCELFRLF